MLDAITGELLDEPKVIRITDEEKESYFDDGTNGDAVAGDGIYALVWPTNDTDFISAGNQRLKQMLIQSLYEVDRIDPVDVAGLEQARVDPGPTMVRTPPALARSS